MKVVSFILALVLTVSSLTEDEYLSSFENFKIQYGKTYLSSEESYRYQEYKNNLDFVNNWDESKGFSVKMNSFGDLSSEEFTSLYNGVKITSNPNLFVPLSNYQVQAATVDWRTKGAVTGVKDQGQCGSCWSFSATGSMEGAHFLKTGKLVSLSEQNLVDCSTSQGNDGCNGGLMDQAFQYVIDNHGIDTEASYRYTATGPNDCKFSAANVGSTISSFHDIPPGDENALQDAVDKQPVSVAIDASHQSFQFYSSGVYYESACSSSDLDHGVLAIGYGSENGENYWLVKNSWGTDWGLSGYINMSKNRNNNCGIASAASYPIV